MSNPLRRFSRPILASVCFLAVSAAFAGFASNEVYLASIGRGAGAGGAQFYSTIWVTNLSSSTTVHFTFTFLKDGQSNLAGAPFFQDTLAAGQTKLYENVTETKLNLPGQFGAARITADGEILASERVYNLAHATDNLGSSEGLFFAAVPKNFAIGMGESASIQGVNQGSPTEDMRSNFDLVETTGNSCTVHVTLLDQNGASQGAADVPMQPYGHVKQSAQALLHSIATINDRIVATVTSGSGRVILAGEQLANTSQDSSGFEMSFKDGLLGGGTGVTSLNGLTGAVTLGAGSNVTITPSGQTITISATGGSGGELTLPFSGTAGGSQTTFAVSNTGTGQAIEGDSSAGASSSTPAFAIKGASSGMFGTGVYGTTRGTSGETGWAGVWGDSHDATAVQGTSVNDRGVLGITSSTKSGGVEGKQKLGSGIVNTGYAPGVWGDSVNIGVLGTGTFWGVFGISTNGIGGYGEGSTIGLWGKATGSGGTGVLGNSASGIAVSGESTSNIGVKGVSHGSAAGVFATSGSGDGVTGFANGASSGSGVAGVNDAGNVGIYGRAKPGSNKAGFFDGGITVVNGSKSFVEPHPTDPTKEIRYVCLEGRESGTYFRGTARIVNGFATIDVPEDFRIVSTPEGLTVQLTPVGEMAVLAAVSRSLDRIVVQGSNDVEFDYMVNGVRNSVPRLAPIEENSFFVPRSAQDPALTRPLPEETRARLVGNGILNPDGSINLETAHRLGWDRQESWKRAEGTNQR